MANKRINMMNGHEFLIDDNDRIADDSIQSLTGVTPGTGLASRAVVLDSSGNVALPGSIGMTKIVASTSDTATSGTNAKSTIDVAVAPTGSSTQVFFGERVQITYNSTQNMAAGGYICPVQYVVNTAGAGTHDKIVGAYTQLNITGGNVTALVGNETAIASVGASTTIASAVINYVPNMAAVPNISNITTLYSYAIDHYASLLKNSGRYMKTMDASGAGAIMREVAAAYHSGYAVSMYYGPRGRTGALAPVALTQYIVNVTPHHIAERTTFTKVGLNVTTAVGGSTIRIGIYQMQGGQLTGLVVDAGTVSSAGTGPVEATISATLEAGPCVIVCQCSAAGVSVNGATINSLPEIFGVATNTGTDCTPFYSPGAAVISAYPSTFPGVLSYTSSSFIVPFIWLRK